MKTPITNLLLAAGTVLLLTSSCTTLLRATFERVPSSQPPPRGDIPGAPSGDVISYIPEYAPVLRVIPEALETPQSLALTPVDLGQISGHYRGVHFRGVATDLNKDIVFTWLAKHNSFECPEVYISCSFDSQTEGNTVPIASFIVGQNNIVRLQQGGTTYQPPPAVAIAVLERNAVYRFAVRISFRTNRIYASVSPKGELPSHTVEREILIPRAWIGQRPRPTISVRLVQSYAGTERDRFIIDDLSIERQD